MKVLEKTRDFWCFYRKTHTFMNHLSTTVLFVSHHGFSSIEAQPSITIVVKLFQVWLSVSFERHVIHDNFNIHLLFFHMYIRNMWTYLNGCRCMSRTWFLLKLAEPTHSKKWKRQRNIVYALTQRFRRLAKKQPTCIFFLKFLQ